MFEINGKLILASGSPRRLRFLEELKLNFTVMAAAVDEGCHPGEKPEEYVRRLSRDKAMDIGKKHPDCWVIGADTSVVLDGEILGKPADRAEALVMLRRLAGRSHEVWTGFTICRGDNGEAVTRAVRTEVTFVDADDEVLVAYAASREPLDKAGAYGIQGKGGLLVSRINGSYSNVVGLPMAELVQELLKIGVVVPVAD